MMGIYTRKEDSAALAYLCMMLLLCSSFGNQITKAAQGSSAEATDYSSTGKATNSS
jgi:hypothetical protein